MVSLLPQTRVGKYVAASVALAGGAVSHAWWARGQFYSTVVLLATSRLHAALIGNLGLCGAALALLTAKSLLAGRLSIGEAERLEVGRERERKKRCGCQRECDCGIGLCTVCPAAGQDPGCSYGAVSGADDISNRVYCSIRRCSAGAACAKIGSLALYRQVRRLLERRKRERERERERLAFPSFSCD